MAEYYHDFKEQLAYSQRQSDDPFWDEVYRKAFPDFTARKSVVADMRYQKMGVDSIITLASGRKAYVDEKMRKRTYPDILMEYTNIYKMGGGTFPGWIEKPLAIDYLAYAMKPKVCYVLPWQQLKKAWAEHKDDWFRLFTPVPGVNRTYTTWSLPIPTDLLLGAIQGAMTLRLETI